MISLNSITWCVVVRDSEFSLSCVNRIFKQFSQKIFNPLYAELNPICHLLALLGAHHILHFSRIRIKLQIPFNGRINELRCLFVEIDEHQEGRVHSMFGSSESENGAICLILCFHIPRFRPSS